jgi:hypothetical protein
VLVFLGQIFNKWLFKDLKVLKVLKVSKEFRVL